MKKKRASLYWGGDFGAKSRKEGALQKVEPWHPHLADEGPCTWEGAQLDTLGP